MPADECRAWDVNELVFSGAMWPSYQNILRADFGLFDTYAYRRAGQAPFDFPMTAFYATRGKCIRTPLGHIFASSITFF